MKFIAGSDRNQIPLFQTTLDDAISPDHEVRLIDLFVNSLSFPTMGFKFDFIENGRPAYHPADLLKIFIYGYLNRIRSSRTLEKECGRNIEMMWLAKGLKPDHNTISNFRRDNPTAIRNVFRATVRMAKDFELIGGQLLAGDSTKLRAQNSKKNNFNPKKIEKHIAYIDAKLEEYNAILATGDQDVPEAGEKTMVEKIAGHLVQKEKYLALDKQLKESGETQISASDPESRQMITRNNITEVAYNVQATIDAKHNLAIDYLVTNRNDTKAMGEMVERAKTILGTTDFTVLYDKGYHTGSEFERADKLGITVLVGIPDVAAHAPDHAFDVANFKYDQATDTHICPAGQTLVSNGNWYNKDRGKSVSKVKHYKTAACAACPSLQLCTKNQSGRLIERSEFADLIFQNKQGMESNKGLYRRRQAIVEHPFGIIKRQWDFYYIMTKKSIERASADVGIIFTAFNLRRIFNIMDKDLLKAYLKGLALCIWFLSARFRHLRPPGFFLSMKCRSKMASLKVAQKRLYLSCARPFLLPI
jgi:transposase